MGTIDIYTIADPVTEEVRYVGQTKRGLRRKYEHFSNMRSLKKPKYALGHWMDKCRRRGVKPIYTVIDTVPASEGSAAEIRYIKLYKAIGAHLLNLTPGGDYPEIKENHISNTIRGKTMVEFYGEESAKGILQNRRKHFLGPNNPNFGGQLSAESIAKNRLAQQMTAISVFIGEDLIGIFINAREAAKFIGCRPSKIRYYKAHNWKVNRIYTVVDTPKELIPEWKIGFTQVLYKTQQPHSV